MTLFKFAIYGALVVYTFSLLVSSLLSNFHILIAIYYEKNKVQNLLRPLIYWAIK